MASFAELLRTAVSAAVIEVTRGSRRNAEDALAVRRADALAAAETLQALGPAAARATGHRRSA